MTKTVSQVDPLLTDHARAAIALAQIVVEACYVEAWLAGDETYVVVKVTTKYDDQWITFVSAKDTAHLSSYAKVDMAMSATIERIRRWRDAAGVDNGVDSEQSKGR